MTPGELTTKEEIERAYKEQRSIFAVGLTINMGALVNIPSEELVKRLIEGNRQGMKFFTNWFHANAYKNWLEDGYDRAGFSKLYLIVRLEKIN